MALRKNERILNLLFALMSTDRFLTKSQIRQIIEDYQPLSDDAFERQFERDKEGLRALGVPIETGSYEASGPEDGYRIVREAIVLPDIELTREEAAVVSLAGQVWQDSAMGHAVSTSLAKLKTIGMHVDSNAINVLTAHIKAEDAYLESIIEAQHSRRVLTFDYVDSQGKSSKRKLQPWGLLNWKDRWYVGGMDTDRGEPRLFRLSRISSSPKVSGPVGSYDIPTDVSLKDIASKMFKTQGEHEATVAIRNGRAHALRQRGTLIETGAPMDTFAIDFSDIDEIASEICSYGSDAIAISPPEVRETVIAKLQKIGGAA